MTFQPPGDEVKRAIVFSCLFPGHLQHSSCVGRCFTQSLELQFGPARGMKDTSGAAGLWKFTQCCSRGKSLAFACQRNCLTARVSALQAAAGIILLAYENICLKKKIKPPSSAIWHLKPYFNFWVQLFLWTYCKIPVHYPSVPTWCLQGWVL